MERVDPVEAWLAALDERHRADLDFKELRRGIQALSSLYVERRDRLRSAGGPSILHRELVEAIALMADLSVTTSTRAHGLYVYRELADMFRYWDVFSSLVMRDFKARYRAKVLGIRFDNSRIIWRFTDLTVEDESSPGPVPPAWAV